MKILLFGISNVGKSTTGKTLSEKLHYTYDDNVVIAVSSIFYEEFLFLL